jgi:hypothetical protein
MVTAGQWQAVKDTLSRPNVRSMTTSDTLGNSTTSTAYSTILRQLHATLIQQPMLQPSLCQILCYDTLDTAITMLGLSLQPIPNNLIYDTARY